jgi:hypothetical protein
MADTRVFRLTYEYGNLEFCNFRAVVQKGGRKSGKGCLRKIEATNAEATEGWTEVTGEFLTPYSQGEWHTN